MSATARADVHTIPVGANSADEVATVIRLVAARDGLNSDVARMLGVEVAR